jgi:hypothetical protein
MTDLGKLISNLGSPKATVRYDACEELRVASSIPAEAIAALEKALNDADRLVRESAQSALRVHKPQPSALAPSASAHQPTSDLSSVPSQPTPQPTRAPVHEGAPGLGTNELLAQILAQQKEHTRLLHNISTAATLFTLLILLSLILGFCSFFIGGI